MFSIVLLKWSLLLNSGMLEEFGVLETPSVRPEEIAALLTGSVVEVKTLPVDDSAKYVYLVQGTVLNAQVDRLEMVDCKRNRLYETSPAFLGRLPYVSSYFTAPAGATDFVSLYSIPTPEIASVQVVVESPISVTP